MIMIMIIIMIMIMIFQTKCYDIDYDNVFSLKNFSDSNKKFSETDIIKMLDFVIEYIFVTFGGRVFSSTVGIQIGTTCAPLLDNWFLNYNKADLTQELLRKKDKNLAISVYFIFCYKDDILNNSKFSDYVERIYLIELEIKDTTDTVQSASYLD